MIEQAQNFANAWGLEFWALVPTMATVWVFVQLLNFVEIRIGDRPIGIGPWVLRKGWWAGDANNIGVRDVIGPLFSLFVALVLCFIAVQKGDLSEHWIMAGVLHTIGANVFYWIVTGRTHPLLRKKKGT